MRDSKKRVFKPTLETRLAREDMERVAEVAKAENKTKSEILREAVLWYLDNRERIKNEPHDTAVSVSIEAMTNRVCAMLARQGRQVATLFELTHDNMTGTPEGEAAFSSALSRASQKMVKRMQEDEREVADAMKKSVKQK